MMNRDSKQVRDYSETHSVSDVLRDEFFEGGLDAPQYPQERETVGGQRVVITEEFGGRLFGRRQLSWGGWVAYSCEIDGSNVYPLFAECDLKPLTPPEPEVVEIDDTVYAHPKGDVLHYRENVHGGKCVALLHITGTTPKPEPGAPLVTYRAPILTDERREAIKEGLSAAKARLPAYDKRLATLRDMLGESD